MLENIDKNERYRVRDCEQSFRGHELHLLSQFFNCQSDADVVLAAQRYDYVYDSDYMFFNPETRLVRVLALASEAFVNFGSLEKPLTLRYPEKQNGPHPKVKLPPDIFKTIDKFSQKQDWGKKPTLLDIIKRLRGLNILSPEVEASTWKKAIEARRRSEKEMIKNFDLIAPEYSPPAD